MRKILLSLFFTTIYFTTALCDVSHVYNNQNNQRYNVNQQDVRSHYDHQHHDQHYHGQDGRYSALNDGTGWDIRLSVPGEPDRDYPVLDSIPKTAFSCSGRAPGYYADTQTRCQVFKVCANTAPNGFFSFLCPNGTLFNQEVLVCDWWMNVKCVDTERYSGVNEDYIVKSGASMMADIKNMIMYPMTHPYKGVLPQMRSLEQIYNPPIDMFVQLQQPINEAYENDVTMNFKYARPFEKKVTAYSSGSLNRYHENVPANHNPVYTENLGGNFLNKDNFNGVSVQKSFKANREERIKVTKQEFTYPSARDRQFIVSSSPRPIVHIPINLPAIDYNYNGVSGMNSYKNMRSIPSSQSFINKAPINIPNPSKSSEPLPFIVLLLQPPFEHSKFNLDGDESRKISSFKRPYGFNDNIPQTKVDQTKSYKNHYFPNNYNQADRMRKPSNNASHFTANVASQTNYYITNNLLTAKRRMDATVPTDVENIDKPSRLTDNSKDIMSSNNITITSFLTNTSPSKNISSQIRQIIENNMIENDRNNSMITLFSATIIPSGDLNKKRVLKICIPKDMLSFLVNLHNSTKTALEMSHKNGDDITNKTFTFQGMPFIRKFMEKMFMKNNILNRQVPIATGEEIYISQKTLKQNQNIDVSQSSQISQEDKYHQSSEVKKYSSVTKNEDLKDLGIKYANENVQIGSQPNVDDESGGAFYSVQQTNYHNIPNKIKDDNPSYKVTNETKSGHFVSTTVVSNYPNQINQGYENTNVNYSSNNQQIQSTVHTIVENSAYKETNQFYNNIEGGIHQMQVLKQDIPKEGPPPNFSTVTQPTVEVNQKGIYSSTYQNNQQEHIQNQEDSNRINTNYDSVQNRVNNNFVTQTDTIPKVYSYESTITQHITPADQPGTVLYSNHNTGFTKLIPAKSSIQVEEQKQASHQNTISQNIEQDQNIHYPTQNNQYQVYNSDNRINYKQNTDQYASVEVVPALGFAFDSKRERQDYYNALSKGLKQVSKEYEAPYTRQIYTGDSYHQNGGDVEYIDYPNQQGYDARYENANRIVHGHIIMHPQTQSNVQSLPLEDFGYLREKPSIPFRY